MARRKPTHEELLILELSSIKAAINNNTRAVLTHSANTAKWLGAVAEAAANPADNTEEVQRKLDELATHIEASTKAVEETLEQQQLKEN